MIRTTTALALIFTLGACEEVDGSTADASSNADVMVALQDLQERFDALEAEHVTLQESHDDLASEMSSFSSEDDRIDDLEDTVEAQQEEIDSLNATLISTELQLEVNTDLVGSLNTQLESVATLVGSGTTTTTGQFVTTADLLDAIQAELTTDRTRMDGFDTRMGGLESVDDDTRDTLAQLDRTVNNHTRDLEQVNDLTAHHEGELSSLGLEIDQAARTDTRLENLIENNTSFIDDYSTTVMSLDAHADDISTLFRGMTGADLEAFVEAGEPLADLFDVLSVDASTGTITINDATLELHDGSAISADCTSEATIMPEDLTCNVIVGPPGRP
jgi:uncharacterized coiled-coil protein SlyX